MSKLMQKIFLHLHFQTNRFYRLLLQYKERNLEYRDLNYQ